MPYNSGFDLRDVLTTLDSVLQQHAAKSKERSAVELAAISLLYAQHLGKLDDFIRYYQAFLDPSFTIKVTQDFVTQADADAWLGKGQATGGERVRIAGKGFQAVHLPHGWRFIYAPLPDEDVIDD